MSNVPSTSVPDHLLASNHSDWKDDESVVARFDDGGGWCTNYGRACLQFMDGKTCHPVQAAALDDNTISYIKAIARSGHTYVDIRKCMVGVIVSTHRNNVRRKELERVLAEEVAAKEIITNSHRSLTSLIPSDDPEVKQAIRGVIESLDYSVYVIQHRIEKLNDEINELV